MGTSELRQESKSSDFLNSLTDFSKQHRAQRWEGSLGDFLTQILPTHPTALVRSSHEYIWDMLLWYGRDVQGTDVQKASRAGGKASSPLRTTTCSASRGPARQAVSRCRPRST